MKILIVHRYYWPDAAPCAHIIHHLASHFAKENHDVDVITGQPSRLLNQKNPTKPPFEIIDNVRITRLSLPTEAGYVFRRVLNAIKIGLKTVIVAIQKKPDVIIATSIPPVLSGFFSALAAKITGARLIYFIMDMHPEIGRISGDFSNKTLYRLLERIDIFNCKSSHTIIVHSEDMKNALLKRRNSNNLDIKIINNFAIPTEDRINSYEQFDLQSNKNNLTIIYAGNVGRFQGLEDAIEAIARVDDTYGIELIIMGNGYLRSTLESLAQRKKANVRFIDQQPIEIAKQAIAQADLGLISLQPGVYQYAYPGKTMVYLEQGTPIIGFIEPYSDIAKDMEQGSYGFSVRQRDTDAFVELAKNLALDKHWRQEYKINAKRAFEANFTPKDVLRRWSDVIYNASRLS